MKKTLFSSSKWAAGLKLDQIRELLTEVGKLGCKENDQLVMLRIRVWFHLQPGSRIGMKAPKIDPKHWTTEIFTKNTQNSHISFQDIFFAEHFTASKASKFSKKKNNRPKRLKTSPLGKPTTSHLTAGSVVYGWDHLQSGWTSKTLFISIRDATRCKI